MHKAHYHLPHEHGCIKGQAPAAVMFLLISFVIGNDLVRIACFLFKRIIFLACFPPDDVEEADHNVDFPHAAPEISYSVLTL